MEATSIQCVQICSQGRDWIYNRSYSSTPLIDKISDLLSQGCTDLQSMLKCLVIEILCQIQCAVKQGCVRLRHALAYVV